MKTPAYQGRIGMVRLRLAKAIVEALRAQHSIEAYCEGWDLIPNLGAWRITSGKLDCATWTGFFQVGDVRHSLLSYDRMSSCIKGLTIERYRGNTWKVHATTGLPMTERFK